ncbi:type III-A CRISPR-associated protein Cas10/Csm1 [Rhodothermus profundi]|uniref:CRISPR system single-strand-specific deoxyribonuclease Cas10/Csm1 (subtype III-A) n=1 Tax=Rhodothermus profundi TaxID=633813 RepID=A0A1M6SLA7_9BACT|nr:CRISPR-associated protein Csm1 [Rhodothermus profundi]SHK45437.1 CRISPR-associated protein Csm1 [Rhodothermus profundi]
MEQAYVQYLGTLLYIAGLLKALGEETNPRGIPLVDGVLTACPAFQPLAPRLQAAAHQAAHQLPFQRPTTWLESPLQFLRLPGRPCPNATHVYRPCSMVDGVVYPVPSEQVTDGPAACRKLWQELQHEAQQVLQSLQDVEAAAETLYTLLEKYTAYVPAPFEGARAISLFDFARITAALQLCRTKAGQEPSVRLIKGDVSGIQSFIYRELRGDETENPAQLLRGRSFFVTLLGRTIVRYLQRQLQLPDGCVLFCSGGHFLMIAPNTAHLLQQLEQEDRRINEALFRELGGAIQLVMASVAASAADVEGQPTAVLQQLEEKLQRAKLRKGWAILDTLLEGSDSEDPSVGKLDRIGRALPFTRYLIEVPGAEQPAEREHVRAVLELPGFKVTWWFVADDCLDRVLTGLGDRRVTLFNLRSPRIPVVEAPRTGCRFMPAGTYIPMTIAGSGQRPCTFEELARMDSENYPMLGFLRMDVDNLGALFVVGLRDAFSELPFTLHRTAALSRELDRFFGGHINRLAEGYDIYLVYAGGDDLFAVGSWVRVLRFARSVQAKLCAYSGNNPSVTVSAGLSIHKEHFPITVAAETAGEEEEHAKNAGKNRIALFSTPVEWSQLPFLLDELAESLLRSVQDDQLPDNQRIPRTFLHTLLRYSYEVLDRQKGCIDLKALARLNHLLHYAFARRGVHEALLHTPSDHPNQPLVQLARCFLLERPDRSEWFRTFVIPAAYVLLKTRKQRD